MRVLNKMSIMTTLSLCVSCEFSREIRIVGRAPTFFLNKALLRLNPAMQSTMKIKYMTVSLQKKKNR